MNWKGINQIGSYLNQSGVPAGQSQDIVVRLRQMIEAAVAESKAYTDGKSSLSDQRVIGPEDANNNDFFNEFKTPEQRPKQGQAGQDGLPGGGWGGGEDGEDGKDGNDGGGNDGGGGGDPGGGGGGGGYPTEPECNEFRRKTENCGCDSFKKMFQACDLDDLFKVRLECPNGSDICAELATLARRLNLMDKRIKEIEKQLEDTVDC